MRRDADPVSPCSLQDDMEGSGGPFWWAAQGADRPQVLPQSQLGQLGEGRPVGTRSRLRPERRHPGATRTGMLSQRGR